MKIYKKSDIFESVPNKKICYFFALKIFYLYSKLSIIFLSFVVIVGLLSIYPKIKAFLWFVVKIINISLFENTSYKYYFSDNYKFI